MGLYQGHRERMKEEFVQGGLTHFSEARVLELLLFYSRAQGDVNPLAHRLLSSFGSLAGVLDAPIEELRKTPGVGENTAVLLKLIPALSARYLTSRTSKQGVLTDSRSLLELFSPHFFGATNEMTYLACFNGSLKLLGLEKLSEGSPGASEVSVRAILAAAFKYHATVVVLAHNHPSGVAAPSQEDLDVTKYVQDALSPAGITLYDHVIVTDSAMFSLREQETVSAF